MNQFWIKHCSYAEKAYFCITLKVIIDIWLVCQGLLVHGLSINAILKLIYE